MDWLLPQQARIEQALAKRHLAEGALVLYDLTSTYFEGRHCPLGKLGHSRDDQKGKLQVVFGLMTNAQGCPLAVEVYAGNTSDPKTVSDQVTKLRNRFGLQRVILVGDRGMITSARIRENLKPAPGIEWITALRAPAIKKLASDGVLQLSLFDKRDLAEITHPRLSRRTSHRLLQSPVGRGAGTQAARVADGHRKRIGQDCRRHAPRKTAVARQAQHRAARGQSAESLQNGKALSSCTSKTTASPTNASRPISRRKNRWMAFT